MSVLDFEEQLLNYVWRGLVLAGLVTVLGGLLTATPGLQVQGPNQRQMQGATNTASMAGSSTAASSTTPASTSQTQ